MAGGTIPRWQVEIEEILREQFQGSELLQQLEKAKLLADLTRQVEIPRGHTGQMLGIILKLASKELRPLSAVYVGFQLGVAWERLQNATELKGGRPNGQNTQG